jgi:hypothetical protein
MTPRPGTSQVLAILDRFDPFRAVADTPALGAADVAELATIPHAQDVLVQIAGDDDATPARRYAAAEALLEGQLDDWRASSAAQRAVAQALAMALRDDTSHNRWGMPGEFPGRLGKQLLSLTDGVVDALVPLLDDALPLAIHGSEAATLSKAAGYRIADLAAYLLLLYRGDDWDAPGDVATRDAQIAALRAELTA